MIKLGENYITLAEALYQQPHIGREPHPVYEAALAAHAKDEIYFFDHVVAVTKEVMKHTDDDDTIIASLFHDAVEDTDITLNEIATQFGWKVAAIVDSVTDAEGPNRKTRKLLTYSKTRKSVAGILIKLCDRLDNVRRTLRNDSHHAGMYAKEYYTFKAALWEPAMWARVWAELDHMHTLLDIHIQNRKKGA